MNREVDRVYRGNLDPSGKIFKEYSKLFTNLATLDARRLTGLTAKQNLLHPNRPFRAEAIKEIVETLGRDMTFNTALLFILDDPSKAECKGRSIREAFNKNCSAQKRPYNDGAVNEKRIWSIFNPAFQPFSH
jgi:hypothetical protein